MWPPSKLMLIDTKTGTPPRLRKEIIDFGKKHRDCKHSNSRRLKKEAAMKKPQLEISIALAACTYDLLWAQTLAARRHKPTKPKSRRSKRASSKRSKPRMPPLSWQNYVTGDSLLVFDVVPPAPVRWIGGL